jgi:osmotically-inducible protein OsmY
MTYPEAELVQWIEDAMLMDPRVSAHAIEVSVSAGVVTLEGTVQAEERKEVALAIAAAHPSCQGVVDRVRVVAPGELPDDEVAHNARAALDTLVDSVRQAAKLFVSGGVVTLRGTVPTEWERAVAEDVVLAAPGVRQVANNLSVVGAYGGAHPASPSAGPGRTASAGKENR